MLVSKLCFSSWCISQDDYFRLNSDTGFLKLTFSVHIIKFFSAFSWTNYVDSRAAWEAISQFDEIIERRKTAQQV